MREYVELLHSYEDEDEDQGTHARSPNARKEKDSSTQVRKNMYNTQPKIQARKYATERFNIYNTQPHSTCITTQQPHL